MTVRAAVALAATAGVGAALLSTPLPWFRRPPLRLRLARHVAATGGPDRHSSQRAQGWATTTSARVSEGTARALACTHRADAADRIRFATAAGGMLALAGAVLVIAIASPPAELLLPMVVPPVAMAASAPHIAARHAAARWQADVHQALPDLCERVSILLTTGRSLTSAIHECAHGSTGPIGRDLRWVDRRLRTGDSLDQTLDAWARRIELPAIDRLVAVLHLHQVTPDLARLVAREAEAVRAEVHRLLLARLDRRAEQVWIPVTVAALVPGAIVLLLPFFDALDAISAS